MDKVRVGVVGVGHLGRFHALNYKKIDEAELIGVYDQDAEKARTIAKECKCLPFDKMEDLLERVEAVSIAVPTDRHFPVGAEILKKGVHCLIEKPIAKDLKEADGLVTLAKKWVLFYRLAISNDSILLSVLLKALIFNPSLSNPTVWRPLIPGGPR